MKNRRCLHFPKNLLQAITSVHLGDGRACSFWSDVWLGDEAFADLHPALFSHCVNKEITVNELMATGLRHSLVSRLSRRATEELQELQLLIANTALSAEPDQRSSPFTNARNALDSGAIYSFLKAQKHQTDERSSFVWQNSAPPRVQLFMWLLVKKRIQCRTVLQKKHVLQSSLCEICGVEDETPVHIVSGCALGKLLWEKLSLSPMIGRDVNTLHTLPPLGGVPSEEFPAFIALCYWEIWKARNAAVFKSEFYSINQLLMACKSTAMVWRSRFKKKKKHLVDSWCQLFEMARQS